MINNYQIIICEWLGNDILSIFVLVLGLLIFINCTNVNAQLIHIPSYSSTAKITDIGKVENKLFPNVHKPPNIEVLSKELKQGKNVIRVNVTSEAGIDNCKIKYVRQGSMKTVDCVNDHNTVYKALIDADPPSSTIEIYVQDIYGDTTDSIKRLNVVPQPSILDLIWNSFSGIR